MKIRKQFPWPASIERLCFIGALGIITAILPGVSQQARAADGDMDSTFGYSPVWPAPVKTFFGGSAEAAYGVVPLPDGRIIVAGQADFGSSASEFALARYNNDGSLDTTFNGTGKVLTAFSTGPINGARALIVQPSGKYVAGGCVNTSSTDTSQIAFALVRYNPDGSLDSSFGAGGQVITPISKASMIHAMTQTSDGTIIAVGRAFDGTYYDFAGARYTVDGALINSFSIPLLGDEWANGVAVQPDGNLVIVGHSQAPNTTSPSNPYGVRNFAILRCSPTGVIDTSFGGGAMYPQFSNNTTNTYNEGHAVLVQTDGKIVAAGSAGIAPQTEQFALVRYNSDGTLDTSFGTGGKVITQLGNTGPLRDNVESLALQNDGKIIAAGFCTQRGTQYFGLARYNTNGTLDTTFGASGKVVNDHKSLTSPVSGSIAGEIHNIAFQNDGKLVVAGFDAGWTLTRYFGTSS